MPDSDDLLFSLEHFCGTARLFPLPGLVMFPHVVQPLHVFEPRYREMTADALEGDQLIAMAVLDEHCESCDPGRPPIHAHACLGRIQAHRKLADGRYYLLLAGLRRVRIVRELETGRSFREAEVRVLEDRYPLSTQPGRDQLHEILLNLLEQTLAPDDECELDSLLDESASLGTLSDVLSYAVEMQPEEKLELLAETNVDRRARRLLEILDLEVPWNPRKYPPDFSDS